MARNVLSLLLAVTIFGLTYGLSAPLIALRLSAAGYSELWVGINAAMHALGVLIIAPALPRLCRQYTPRRLLIISLASAALLLWLFTQLPLWSSFILRLLLGMATEVILVVTETAINHQSNEHQRAQRLAIYTALLSLGFALGPFILSTYGSSSGAFIIAAGLSLLAAISLLSMQRIQFGHESAEHRSFLSWLTLLPLALAATFLNAALEAAGMNLLALYAMKLGWAERDATSLITLLMVGAILLQLPVGWLADRVDRMKLVVWLAALSSLGALIWPLIFSSVWLARIVLFCWGGVFVGIYTVIITLVGQQFKGAELAGAYGTLSVAWGAGALIGPTLGGAAMSLTLHGLPWLAAVLCGCFTLFAWKQSRTA